jgi:Sulfotransferase family
MQRFLQRMATMEHHLGPIFIGGAGRSGTTLIRVMLDAHPRICCGPELKILPQLALLHRDLTTTFASIMQSYGNSPTDLQPAFREFIEALVANFLRRSGKPRWAEKTPHNVTVMLELGTIFPDARFLHIVRDGRDVACSLVTMNWINPRTGQKVDYIQSVRNAARYWRDIVRCAREQAAHRSLAGRVLEVRYEALVADAEHTLRYVLQFVDEPWDPAVLTYHDEKRQHEPREQSTLQVSKPVYGSAVGRWRTEMTREDKIAFKAEAGELLRELGYASDEW